MSFVKLKTKKLSNQIVVITGATYGVGLITARLAAQRVAKLVLTSDHGEALHKLVEEISAQGVTVLGVMGDPSKLDHLIHVKNEAVSTFGKIDTWINLNHCFYEGPIMGADIKKEKKVFETIFWANRLGSQVAIDAMKERGGTLINIGSEITLNSRTHLGIYLAAKAALKALTESLRLEVRDNKIPVDVCLLRPHQLSTEDQDLDLIAKSILKCAESPVRDFVVGGPARISDVLDTFFPAVKDMMEEARLKKMSHH